MTEYLKKNLQKHKYSKIASSIWACVGYMIFSYLVTPVAFEPIMYLWNHGWRTVAPLYGCLFCSMIIVSMLLLYVRRFPYSNRYEVLTTFAFVINGFVLVILAAFRQFYSVRVIVCFILFQILWLGIESFYRAKYIEYHFAVFPTSIELHAGDFLEYRISFLYSMKEIENNAIDAIIVEDENALTDEWRDLLAYCRSMNISEISLEFFLENVWGRVPLDIIDGISSISSIYPGWYLAVKYTLDKILSFLGIVILLPVFVFIAVVLKITSDEPVIFKQRRIGLNGCTFIIYKFRTMNHCRNLDGAKSSKLAISPFCAFLRRFHLDELPQLINVLKGDLTLVGPRPETPELTELYKKQIPFYGFRTRINQGVVGWALIHQGNVCGIEDTRIKLSYDIYYIKRASIFLDIYIIIKSVWLMIFGIEKVKISGTWFR